MACSSARDGPQQQDNTAAPWPLSSRTKVLQSTASPTATSRQRLEANKRNTTTTNYNTTTYLREIGVVHVEQHLVLSSGRGEHCEKVFGSGRLQQAPHALLQPLLQRPAGAVSRLQVSLQI